MDSSVLSRKLAAQNDWLSSSCETSRIACGVPSALTIKSARTVALLSIAVTGNPKVASAARGISTRTTAPSSRAAGPSEYGSGTNAVAYSESSAWFSGACTRCGELAETAILDLTGDTGVFATTFVAGALPESFARL